jgi:transcriptional regulator
MYLPKHFAETRTEVLHELIRAHPLAALVTQDAAGLDANHIPLLVDPGPAPWGTLRGHVARANPLARTGECDALAIFQGPQAYVSPAWYPSKRETGGKVVPTWNYVIVHAHGRLRVIDDKRWVLDLVRSLTERHEAGRPAPWGVSDAPADFIARQLEAIVGIELQITRLTGKWKASQNRPERDRAGTAAGLTAEGREAAAAMSALVRATLPE